MATPQPITKTPHSVRQVQTHPAFRYVSYSFEAHESFIAGTISGTTKCLVGHPFDTIKTRMQTNAAFSGPWECLTRTLKLEGGRGLYKVISPIKGIR